MVRSQNASLVSAIGACSKMPAQLIEHIDLADLRGDPPALGAIGEIAGDGKAAARRARRR